MSCRPHLKTLVSTLAKKLTIPNKQCGQFEKYDFWDITDQDKMTNNVIKINNSASNSVNKSMSIKYNNVDTNKYLSEIVYIRENGVMKKKPTQGQEQMRSMGTDYSYALQIQ